VLFGVYALVRLKEVGQCALASGTIINGSAVGTVPRMIQMSRIASSGGR